MTGYRNQWRALKAEYRAQRGVSTWALAAEDIVILVLFALGGCSFFAAAIEAGWL